MAVVHRVLSLGAGVQSSALLLMSAAGELEHLDAAIFADTGWEPKAVYAWLDELDLLAAAAGIPLLRVSGGDLRADALAGRPSSWMPLYARGEGGRPQQLRRQCTANYKIRPIRRALRALGYGPSKPVEQWIGISLDEYQRARTSDVRYVRNAYPLIDARLTREDCARWLSERGYERPQKSTCIGCPFRTNAEFRALSATEWADAVAFDEQIRERRTKRGQPVYVHRNAMPLGEVDMRSEQQRGQLDMFETDGCSVLCRAE